MLLSLVMLDGVAELKPAVPPDIESTKSVVSSSPVPFEIAYTSSLNVMFMVRLSAARVREVIVGGL